MVCTLFAGAGTEDTSVLLSLLEAEVTAVGVVGADVLTLLWAVEDVAASLFLAEVPLACFLPMYGISFC